MDTLLGGGDGTTEMTRSFSTARPLSLWLGGLLCAALAAPATAQDWMEAYSYDFSSAVENDFSGTDGWVSGWDEDPWTTNAYPGEVNPRTDEGGGQWASSAAISNHLIQTSAGDWANAAVEVQAAIYDTDTLGVVLRKSGAANLYLFFMTTDYGPALGTGGSGRDLYGSFL